MKSTTGSAKKLPSISLATVYNCLEALVNHGLVNQVNFERSSSRFCPNLVDHGHFQDTRTGRIYDITIKEGVDLREFINLPTTYAWKRPKSP